MPSPEGAQEGLSAWQTFAGAAAIFLTTAAGVMARFVAKKAEQPAAGDSGRHVVLEQASIADGGPFIRIEGHLAAIRTLLEEQVEQQALQREQQEKDKIRERLDKADEDRENLMHMIAELRAGREPKLPPKRQSL